MRLYVPSVFPQYNDEVVLSCGSCNNNKPLLYSNLSNLVFNMISVLVSKSFWEINHDASANNSAGIHNYLSLDQ